MSPETILATLRDLGATVEAKGGRLEIKAPRGVLTPELRSELAARKAELLAVLCAHGEGTILCRRCGLGVAEAEPFRDPRVRSGPPPPRFRLTAEQQCPRCRELAAAGVPVIGCWQCRWPDKEPADRRGGPGGAAS